MLEQLIKISRRVGERFDLVQAGGGNTSIKDLNGRMYIKASGVRLSDIKYENQFSIVNNSLLKNLFEVTNWQRLSKEKRESRATEIYKMCNLTPERKPSIETFLHSIGDTACIHTHPYLIVEAFSSKTNPNFELEDIAVVPYYTPGIELTLAMLEVKKEFINKKSKEPDVFILMNHGLVVYGSTPEQAYQKTLNILDRFADTSDKKEIGKKYSILNFISETFENIFSEPVVTIHIGQDINFSKLLSPPFFPDGVVFLAAGPLSTTKNELESDIQDYFMKFQTPPKVVLMNNSAYTIGSTYAKAKEIEEVWNLYISVLKSNFNNIEPLNWEEIHYLSHWEAEKYRQRI